MPKIILFAMLLSFLLGCIEYPKKQTPGTQETGTAPNAETQADPLAPKQQDLEFAESIQKKYVYESTTEQGRTESREMGEVYVKKSEDKPSQIQAPIEMTPLRLIQETEHCLVYAAKENTYLIFPRPQIYDLVGARLDLQPLKKQGHFFCFVHWPDGIEGERLALAAEYQSKGAYVTHVFFDALGNPEIDLLYHDTVLAHLSCSMPRQDLREPIDEANYEHWEILQNPAEQKQIKAIAKFTWQGKKITYAFMPFEKQSIFVVILRK